MTEPPRVRPDRIVLREEPFRLLRVSRLQASAVEQELSLLTGAFRFTAREEDGLSLLISADEFTQLGDLVLGAEVEAAPYRVITFRQDMPWTVVGFLASVCRILAEDAIPLGAISAFARDHLFVRDDLASRALDALRAAASDGRLAK